MTVEWFKNRFKTDQGAEHDGSMTPRNKIEAVSWEKDPTKLHAYLDDTNHYYVQCAAAINKNATKENIDKALGVENYSDAKEHIDGLLINGSAVRAAAAGNQNATKEHLDRALGDNDAVVRESAAGNQNATKEHIDKALMDKTNAVRYAATNNPVYKQHYPNGHTIVNGKVVAK